MNIQSSSLDIRIDDLLHSKSNDTEFITFQEYAELNKSKLTGSMDVIMFYEYVDLSTMQIYHDVITYYSSAWVDNFITDNEVEKLLIKPVSFNKILYHYFYPIDDLLYIVYSHDIYSLSINCFTEHNTYDIFSYSIKLDKLPEVIVYRKLNKKRHIINDLAKIPAIKGRVNYEIFIEKFKQFYPLLKSRILLRALQEK